MHFRPAIFTFFSAIIFLVAGCEKSQPRILSPTILPADTIASIHWRGKHWLGYEATAFYFMRLWNNPPSARLERQTLERLASAPERFFPGGGASRDLMLPLISDLEQEESYLEIRSATNSQTAAILCVHLPDPAQAARWSNNLMYVIGARANGQLILSPDNNGWILTTGSNVIRLKRASDWTLLSFGQGNNSLIADFSARVRLDGVPFVSSGTNFWLEASLAPAHLANIFPAFNSFSSLDHINFTVTGDGGNVFTRGKITFAQPFAAPLPPWNLPVNLLHDPMTSFTAVRGVQSSLAEWQPWHDLEMGGSPDQLFFWSLSGSPYQTYLAAPLTNANVSVAALTDQLVQKGNPWLATNGYISFDRATNGNGVTWGNLPDIKPFIKSDGSDADGWLYAGLLPETNSAALPPSPGLLNDVLRRTNLVYYDWEVTGPRLQPVLSVAQTARLITRRPQLAADSASLNWLGMLIPRLGTSATVATRTGPAELTFVRRSTLGLNAVELHLLAGWLEAPDFPSAWPLKTAHP